KSPIRRRSRAQLGNRAQAMHIPIRVTNGPFRACYDSSRKEIRCSRSLLALLWANAHLALSIYERVYEQTRPGARCVLNLDDDSAANDALELVHWAFTSLESGTIDWPPHLPGPSTSDRTIATASRTTRLFIYALAFVLHHELAHARLHHDRSTVETE